MTRLLPSALACAALAAAASARADDLSDLEGLLEESVIVTASRASESARTAPATSTTITADELRRYGIRSLDQALNFLSLGMVTENPLGTVEIGARGVLLARDYGNHVLLLVDGHAMNEQWDGTAYYDRGAGIPFDLVDHIEVILGPGSVLYGSNAMLGVINIVTRRAKDFRGLHAAVESELATSLRGAAGWGTEFTLLGRPAELTVAVDYYRSRGPAFDYGPQVTGVDQVTGEPRRFTLDGPGTGVWGGRGERGLYSQVPTAYARFIAGNLEIALRATEFKRGTVHGWGAFDDPTGYERDRWLTLDARWHKTLSPVWRVGARLYGDLYQYLQSANAPAAQDCLEGQVDGCRYMLEGIARWGGAELTATADWLHDGRVLTLFGVDGRLRQVGSKDAYLDPGATDFAGVTAADLGDEGALAAFVEQTVRPGRWLGLNAGGRLDYDERFGSHFSPRAAASIAAWNGATIKTVWAEAFRAPTYYETHYGDPMAQIAATDLAPETVRSFEVILEQRFGSQRVALGGFQSRWSGLVQIMEATPEEVAAAEGAGLLEPGLTSVSKYKNTTSIRNWGGHLAAEGTLFGKRLRWGLGLTWAWARQDLADGAGLTPLPGAGQFFGNARASWDFGGPWPVLAMATRFVGKRPVVGTAFEPVPDAPAQVEVRTTLSGAVPAVRGLAWRATFNWAATGRGAYAIGPLEGPTPSTTTQELVPQRRTELTVGLAYDLN